MCIYEKKSGSISISEIKGMLNQPTHDEHPLKITTKKCIVYKTTGNE